MKTSEDILNHIASDMNSMIKRPQMWADTPIGLETQYLGMLELVLFIRDIHVDRIIADWCKFAHRKIGFKGPEPVATYLKKNNMLNNSWGELTELLSAFYSFMSLSSNG